MTIGFYGPTVRENRETVAKPLLDSGLVQTIEVREGVRTIGRGTPLAGGHRPHDVVHVDADPGE